MGESPTRQLVRANREPKPQPTPPRHISTLPPGNPNIVAAAYTNNFAGAPSTTLYDIDSVADQLFMQSPPNNGTLVAVGTGLGVDLGPTVYHAALFT